MIRFNRGINPQSIYPDCLTRNPNTNALLIKLELPVDLGGPRKFQIVDDGTTSQISTALTDKVTHPSKPTSPVITLSHLPSLILDIMLPPTYPLYDPPTILSAYVSHSWLPPPLIVSLLRKFHSLWVEQQQVGQGVLWSLSELIVTGNLLDDISPSSSSLITIPHPAPHILIPNLLAHDLSMNASSFSSTTFTCPICFEARKGSACVQLACEHITCKECLRDYWSLSVREGEVAKVRCPDAACVKKSAAHGEDAMGGRRAEESEAGEEDVRRVLSESEVTRWRWLRTKRAVERDPTTVLCPLQFCQAPVPRPQTATLPEEEEESGAYSSGWDRLRTCEACDYSFCVFCKRSWHGPITPCNTPTTNTFLLEYMSLPEDSPRRIVMERMLGRENVKRMVRKYEEDEKNRAWMEESTTACPGCQVRCQKSHGCNHVRPPLVPTDIPQAPT